jgi:flagellar biosynthesis/type III secretory pathway chaperone
MNKSDCFKRFKQSLNLEIQQVDTLLQLLKRESNTLPNDAETLLTISTEKDKLIQSLNDANQQRQSIIQKLGFNADLQGVERCFRACDQQGQLIAIWKEFLTKAKACRKLNQLNGSTLDSSLRVVKQALSLLYGEKINESTYDEKGHSQARQLGRSIAKV